MYIGIYIYMYLGIYIYVTIYMYIRMCFFIEAFFESKLTGCFSLKGEGFWPCGENIGLLQESWFTCWRDDCLLLRCLDGGRSTPVVGGWSNVSSQTFGKSMQPHQSSQRQTKHIHINQQHTHTPKIVWLVIAQLLPRFLLRFLSFLPVQPVSFFFVTKLGESSQSHINS